MSSKKLWVSTQVLADTLGAGQHTYKQKNAENGEKKNLSAICMQKPLIGVPSCAQVTPKRAQCASV